METKGQYMESNRGGFWEDKCNWQTPSQNIQLRMTQLNEIRAEQKTL